MSDPGLKPATVRYFCTAGNGMEPFLEQELKTKLSAHDVVCFQGKVVFSSSVGVVSVVELKSAERIFLLLKHDRPFKPVTPVKASLLQSRLLDQTELSRAAVTWSRLQRELRHSQSLTDKCGKDGSRSGQKGEDSGIMKEGGSDCPSKRRRLDGQSGTGQSGTDAEQLRLDQVSFRISCRCSGSLARSFSTQEISHILGRSVTSSLGWRVDLRNPLLEINVSLTDDYCLLGIPLTKSPLSCRSYLQSTGLRSTVAWAMASAAQLQPGALVLDPMCGVGTVLIEAAQEHTETFFLGIDIDDEQLVKAAGNVLYAHLDDRIQVLKASCLGLPVCSSSVDAVVCDLPFGRKFGNKVEAAVNLPLILSEMTRVLRVGGCLVLLLSPQLSSLVKKLLTQDGVKPESEEKQDTPSAAALRQQLSHNCTSGTQPGQEPERQSGTQSGQEPERQPGQEPERLSGTQSGQGSERVSGPERLSGTQSGPECVLSCRALLCLRQEQCVRVSLGTIDGLIHKYVKLGPC